MGKPRTSRLDDAGAAPSEPIELRVLEGPDQGRTFALGEHALVGTSEECDVVLSDGAVSYEHVSLGRSEGGISVRDLGSTNGTRYLGTRMERGVVPVGAVLRLGRTRIAITTAADLAGGEQLRDAYGGLQGTSAVMQRVFRQLESLERSEVSVALMGEAGVGKSVAARALHAHSPRCERAFVECRLGRIVPERVELVLFGDGAVRRGLLEEARGGTLFLDHVELLPPTVQRRLSSALKGEAPPDIRFLSATEVIAEGLIGIDALVSDLAERLETVRVVLPPLRARREDIPMLIAAILAELGDEDLVLDAQTIEQMTTAYDWPGNISELRDCVTQVQALGDPLAWTPERLASAEVDLNQSFQEAKRKMVDVFERNYLRARLEAAGQNLSRAARESGVERTAFRRLLKKHGLR